MRAHPLPAESAAQTGVTHLVELTHEDLVNASGNILTLPLGPTAPGQAWMLDHYRLAQGFVSLDPALTSTRVKVGDAANASRFLSDIQVNGANGLVQQAGPGRLASSYVYDATDAVKVTVSAPTALTLFTKGKVLLFFKIATGRKGANDEGGARGEDAEETLDTEPGLLGEGGEAILGEGGEPILSESETPLVLSLEEDAPMGGTDDS